MRLRTATNSATVTPAPEAAIKVAVESVVVEPESLEDVVEVPHTSMHISLSMMGPV
jgi:hypothetical protein